jgi:hypothetical protein
MGDKRGAYRISVGRLEEGNRLEEHGIDGRIILKRILKKLDPEACVWIDVV